MPRKKAVPAHGRVRVSIDCRPSQNFQTFGFQVGADLEIEEGETFEKALARALGLVRDGAAEYQGEVFEELRRYSKEFQRGGR